MVILETLKIIGALWFQTVSLGLMPEEWVMSYLDWVSRLTVSLFKADPSEGPGLLLTSFIVVVLPFPLKTHLILIQGLDFRKFTFSLILSSLQTRWEEHCFVTLDLLAKHL